MRVNMLITINIDSSSHIFMLSVEKRSYECAMPYLKTLSSYVNKQRIHTFFAIQPNFGHFFDESDIGDLEFVLEYNGNGAIPKIRQITKTLRNVSSKCILVNRKQQAKLIDEFQSFC